jgi:MOSC domain-containing protein YiiM
MKVEALCVAKPKTIEHQGKTVSTGIYKTPVEGPRMARRTNIDGDGQADLSVHGGIDKAVYAFPLEHYAFYREALGSGPFDFGQFGENLTVSGLLESEVRIGDRYRAGGALLEVSQPRSPCFKFAIKMGAPEAVRTCLLSARTGFYLRVLLEGPIEAGDAIRREFTDAAAPSVKEVHELAFFDKENVEGLKRAARCTRLASAFRDEFVNRLFALGVVMS